MRSKFSNKHLMAVFFCTTGLVYTGQAIGQDDPVADEQVELFDPAQEEVNQEVGQTDTGDIVLHVKDLDITKVLQLLSIENQKNIIASREVAGKISADLYGVDFNSALDAILLPNGYRWIEEGNFIYVITEAEFEKREQDNRPIVTKVLRLNYLRASEAALFVTPMLSDNGTITASGEVEEGFQADVSNGGSNQYAGAPTLVIRDYEDTVDAIVSLIAELDLQPKQVIIEATILTASLTENNAFGVDFALFSNLSSANPLGAVGDLISGTTGEGLVSSVGNVAPGTQEGVKLGFVAGDAAVFVRALDSVTDTTLIATPKTTVLDRNRADILVGQKIAYLSSTVTETATTETVEFLEVGTQLSVRPFVSDDGMIRLELRPSVSDATIRTIGTTTAPDEETVELITNVIVESGQTIVLGGLFTEDTSIGREQVPGLGNIRGIGRAFRGQDDTVDRSEVIFMVKATVVDNQTLISLANEGMDRIDTAAVGDREQLLPWSLSKLTASHLINARRYYDESASLTGEEKEEKLAQALYCADMALHLNPSMVDALLLKEEITGEQLPIYLESNIMQTFESVLEAEMEGLDLPEMDAQAPAAAPQPEAQAQAEADAEADATAAADKAQAEEEALADVVARALMESDAEQAQAQSEPEFDLDDPAGLANVEVHDEAMDDIWLQDMLDASEPAQPEVEQVEPEVIEMPIIEEIEDFDEQVSDAEQVEEFEEIEPTDPAFADGADTTMKIFGYSWRSLTTAQLLQLASQAAEDTEPVDPEIVDAEPTDAAQAEVDTNAQWEDGK